MNGISVVVYDLDGTLYADKSQFDYYARRLCERLPGPMQDRFWNDWVAAAEGEHALGLGKVYDARRDLIVSTGAEGSTITGGTTWDGGPLEPGRLKELYPGYPQLPPTNMQWFLFMGDLWWLPIAVAIHYGLRGREGQEAYVATRDYMMSPEYQLEPDPGLRECLEQLRRRGIRQVLATNSPESGSQIILRKLGVEEVFDELLFECNKPAASRQLLSSLVDRYAGTASELLSVGDNYTNEIVPAHELGARTLFIDAYQYLSHGRWDVRVHTIGEALAVLNQVKPPER